MGFYNSSRIENIKNRYFNIRNEVFVSLNEHGRCVDVDEILNKRSIDALAYYAIKDAYMAYIKNENYFPPQSDDRHSDTGKKWIDVSETMIKVDHIRPELFSLIRKASDRFVRNSMYTDGYGTPPGYSAASTSAINDAKQMAERIIAEAKQMAERTIQEAKYEAENIINNAKNREKNLVEAGEGQKRNLIDEGYAEKKRIIENISQKEYRYGFEKCIRDHFKQEQLEERKVRKALEDEYDSLINSKNNMLDSINSGAQTLHSSLMLSFDNALRSIQIIQNDVHNAGKDQEV